MNQQPELDFSPPKTLADYPLIINHYANISDQWLPAWQKDMAKRVENARNGWDKEFAHFHLEAINLEIEKRIKAKNNP